MNVMSGRAKVTYRVLVAAGIAASCGATVWGSVPAAIARRLSHHPEPPRSRPLQDLLEQRPGSLDREALEAAQIVARVTVARAALDPRVVGAVPERLRIREEGGGPVARHEAERRRAGRDRRVHRAGIAAHEGRASRLQG